MAKKTTLLEVFPNEYAHSSYLIEHTAHEFTSLCPKTGQPDFAEITFSYIPDLLCVELKSLKLYLQSFRNQGIFYESVTNKILDDLVKITKPRFMRVTAKFGVRGGISSVITAEYEDPKYSEND